MVCDALLVSGMEFKSIKIWCRVQILNQTKSIYLTAIFIDCCKYILIVNLIPAACFRDIGDNKRK